MVLGLPLKKVRIGARLVGISGGQRKKLRWRRLGAINESKEVLPFEIRNNLGFQ